jgi:hypothetical protein
MITFGSVWPNKALQPTVLALRARPTAEHRR